MYVPLREIAEVFAWMVGIVVGGFLFYVVLAFLYYSLLIIPASAMAALQRIFKFNPPLPTYEELDYLIRHGARNKDERRKRANTEASRMVTPRRSS